MISSRQVYIVTHKCSDYDVVRDHRCETADNMSSKRADREKKAGYRDKYEIDDKLASPSRRARGRDRTTPP